MFHLVGDTATQQFLKPHVPRMVHLLGDMIGYGGAAEYAWSCFRSGTAEHTMMMIDDVDDDDCFICKQSHAHMHTHTRDVFTDHPLL